MSQSKSAQQIEVENEIDNYVRNIEVTMALSDVFKRFKGESTVAKKLFYSGGSDHVTPDLVTEICEYKLGYGIVSESKASLPQNSDHWIQDYKQLLRYDKELLGWSCPIQNHDIVFVTETTLTSKFFKFVEKKNKANKYKFLHRLVYIDSTREHKNINFVVLKQVHGNSLSHSMLSEELRDGTRVPLKNILREIDTTKFLDAHPHVVYTMEIMWDFIFSKMVEEDQIKRSITSTISLTVNIDKVLEEMRLRFSPSNPDVVRREWVKKALDKFVETGLGIKNRSNNQYEIHFRKPPGKTPTRNWLIELHLDPNKRKGKRTAQKMSERKRDPFQPKLDQYFSK